MIKKIKVRSLLLASFQGTRFGTNPYKLHPLADYIYYDALNAWLPILKKEGLDDYDIAAEIVKRATHGWCPEKYARLASSGQPYKEEDLVDESLLKHVDSLTDGDERLKTMMYGGVAGLRY